MRKGKGNLASFIFVKCSTIAAGISPSSFLWWMWYQAAEFCGIKIKLGARHYNQLMHEKFEAKQWWRKGNSKIGNFLLWKQIFRFLRWICIELYWEEEGPVSVATIPNALVLFWERRKIIREWREQKTTNVVV